MIKLTLLILALIAMSNSQATVWTSWNNYAASYPATTRAFVPPAIPADYTRYVDATNATYNTRKNQYRYIFTDPVLGGTINVYCGLRSFLTEINGYIFCTRDTRSMFYGAYPSLNQICIPDVDANAISAMYIPFIGNYNSCNRKNYMSTPYQGYQCCYDDADTNPSGFEFLKKNPTTTLYTLRNTE